MSSDDRDGCGSAGSALIGTIFVSGAFVMSPETRVVRGVYGVPAFNDTIAMNA
jgi:hypothetical protein